MKIMHIITGLEQGGAESALFNLLKYFKKNSNFDFIIVTLTNNVFLKKKFEDLGIEVVVLKMNKNFIFSFYNLVKIYRNFKPKLIQSWLHHSDFIAILLSFITRNKNLIWTIRCGKLDKKFISYKNIYLVKILRYFSSRPKAIIYNSFRAFNEHKKIGYDSKFHKIIHNGFDHKEYKSNKILKNNFKKKYFIKKNVKVIGFISRYHPIKGFDLFISLAEKLNKYDKNLFFVVAGRGYENNLIVNSLIKKHNIKKIFFLGNLNSINNFYPVLDCLVVSSKSESFPNVIAEGMLSKVYCISNDVGDAKLIIDNYGYITSKNIDSDAKKITKIISNKIKMKNILIEGRNHIINSFNISKSIEKFSKVYNRIADE